MRVFFVILVIALNLMTACSKPDEIWIKHDNKGIKLVVNGKDFMINGMNWDYFPIGTNYSYSLWKQSDEIIRKALDTEMSLLKNMGVNAIRQYTGVPPKWIAYIYENYGIYTMLNHSFGRYGLTLDGVWVGNTIYNDLRTKNQLLSEVTQMVKKYKNTKGLLLYLLGNENNYGLFWEGAETENIPVKDSVSMHRARHMYKLFNQAAIEMKAVDASRPIAICNGDVLFIDVIAEECKDIDIFGMNIYRGVSFGDAFQVVKEKLNKPLILTEFGADAFNAIENKEDQQAQAYYLFGNWKEIYENAAGFHKAQNCIGGFTFQFSDGWWKSGQTKNLEKHDNHASWANGGYLFDFEEGKNNMNEEWFGICAKASANSEGLYQLYPRKAYFVLKQIHDFQPYKNDVSLKALNSHFTNIALSDSVRKPKITN